MDDDPMAPMRGLWLGLLISVALYALALGAILWLVP